MNNWTGFCRKFIQSGEYWTLSAIVVTPLSRRKIKRKLTTIRDNGQHPPIRHQRKITVTQRHHFLHIPEP